MTETLERLRELSGHLVDPDIAIAMFESLPDAVIVVDSEGIIQLVNRQAEILFGYHRTLLFDRKIEMLLPSDRHQIHEQHRKHFIDDPQIRPMGVALKVPLMAKRWNGETFEAEINLSPIPTKQGLLVMAVIRRRQTTSRNEWIAGQEPTQQSGTDESPG